MTLFKKISFTIFAFFIACSANASSTDFRFTFFNAITEAENVGYDYFTIFAPVTVEIQTFDEFALGGSTGFDPTMWLFEFNGSLGEAIAFDDDSGVAAYDYNNSYLSLELAAGSYAIAVSDYDLSEIDARNGFNTNIGSLGSNYGSYELVVNTVSAVPEASTIAMMLSGLGVVSFASRRRKSKNQL